MKGILLAGGNGSRLHPSTHAISKHLLPIYDKPMIYYSLSILMLANIREILLITKPEDTALFHRALGDGSKFGISLNYAIQSEANGIPESLKIGKHFLGGDDAFLVLGDNVIFGDGLPAALRLAKGQNKGCTVFTYGVKDPRRYGVLEMTEKGDPKSVKEKPIKTNSRLAITGLYMFSNEAIDISFELRKSDRGETELVDLISYYLCKGKLQNKTFGRGFAWFDTGTHSSLLEASQFVETIERRQGYKVACLEEIAYSNGWIDRNEVLKRAEGFSKNCYGDYLCNVAKS